MHSWLTLGEIKGSKIIDSLVICQHLPLARCLR